MSTERLPNETELQYIWRLGSAKDSGLLDMTWTALADVLNAELREPDEEWTESAYRKKYAQAKAFYEEVFSKMTPESRMDELTNQERELEQKKIQYRDERNAWQKQNYIAARVEQKLDYLEQTIQEIGEKTYKPVEPINVAWDDKNERDMMVCLSDLHIGQSFTSCMGSYNADVAKKRLDEYAEEVVRIAERHDVNQVHIVCLGDLISGSIHKTVQLTNRENVIDQIKLASEYVTDFCYQMTQHFQKVCFYSVPGNHSRIDKKEDALKDERLDDLVSWFVGNSLKHITNFANLTQYRLDSTIGHAVIKDKTYIMIHGDVDSISATGVGNLSLMLGFVPDVIVAGHKHTPAMMEVNGVAVYQSGSLVGSGDEYTMQHRMSGKPSQLVLVCNTQGVECAYNVSFK